MLHGSEHRDERKGMVKLTTEQIRQRARDMRKDAKELQRKMQEVTDSEERKQLVRRMNELFAETGSLRDEAKHRQYLDESIERDFRCLEADLKNY